MFPSCRNLLILEEGGSRVQHLDRAGQKRGESVLAAIVDEVDLAHPNASDDERPGASLGKYEITHPGWSLESPGSRWVGAHCSQMHERVKPEASVGPGKGRCFQEL